MGEVHCDFIQHDNACLNTHDSFQMAQINIKGFNIAYKSWGDPKLPPVIALHGWLDNANSFDLLIPHLAHYHIIAIDLPGHGHSDHLAPYQQYHFIDGIFFVNDIIDAMGFNKVHLIGHSMGACLASLIAASIPEKINKLGLIEGLGPLSREETECVSQIKTHIRYQYLLNTKLSKPYKNLESAAKARAKGGHISAEDALILAKRGTIKKQSAYFWRHDIRLLAPSPLRLSEAQVLTFLKSIETPTCLIFADNGFAFDKELMQKRVEAVPHLEQHMLQGGHHIHMEEPVKTAALLANFFD